MASPAGMNGDTVEIVRATRRDIPAVATLGVLCLLEDGSDAPLTADWQEKVGEYMAAIVGNPDAAVFVAKVGGKCVGMIYGVVVRLSAFTEPIVGVGCLYVHKAHWGRRIAPELIRALDDWHMSTNTQGVIIATRGKNENRQYYRRLGFVESSTVMFKKQP